MNTTKHTPGPWTVCRPICTTHATPIRVHGENLCWVCGLDSALQFSREQTAANARLIAAAPAMLEALRGTLGLAEAYYRTLPDDGAAQDHYMAEVIAPARAAIAAATGE